jgi:hypothetical protein
LYDFDEGHWLTYREAAKITAAAGPVAETPAESVSA